MIPEQFEYFAPSTIDEVLKLMVENDEAKILAGGHSLLPMMKLRFAEATHLIDINGVEALKGISDKGDHILIGAMTTESELIVSELLQQKCPLIPEAAKLIADPQVRNRGTIGGDIAHGDPGNDHPSIMMALDAIFVLQSPDGERTVPANSFFLGTYWTELRENEILKEIQVPVAKPNSGYAYTKLKRKTGDFATAATAVVLTLDGDTCSSISIVMTNVGPTALKAEEAENLLTGKVIDESLIEEAAEKAMSICDPAEDLRGDVEYKTHMAGEMTRRAIRIALQRAKGEI
jgi:carbon-monoxide dehydrogenase medium subunit